MLTLEQVARLFTQRNWSRGEELNTQGLVVEVSADPAGQHLSGTVATRQGGKEYEVSIASTSKGVFCDCQCPIGQFCQHAAALCHAHWQSASQRIAVSEAQITQWLATAAPEQGQLTRCLLFVINHRHGQHGMGFEVQLETCQRLKSGELSTTSRPLALPDSGVSLPWMSQQERHLCSDIIAHRQPDGCCYDYALLHELVATGRAFWQQRTDRALSWQQPLTVDVSIQQTEKGLVELQLVNRPGEVLATIPPVWLDRESQQMCPLESQIAPEALSWLTGFPVMDVEQFQWSWPQIQQRLGDQAEFLSAPKHIQTPQQIEPNTRVYLFSQASKPQNGVLRLEFDYQGISINPLSDSATYTDTRGALCYRNTAFELAVMEQLQELGFKQYQTLDSKWQVLQHCQWYLTDLGHWYHIVHKVCEDWRQRGWQVTLDDNFYYQVQEGSDGLALSVQETETGMFATTLTTELEEQSVSLIPLLSAAIKKQGIKAWLEAEALPDFVYLPLGKGEAIAVDAETVKSLVTDLLQFIPEQQGQEEVLMPAHLLARPMQSKQVLVQGRHVPLTDRIEALTHIRDVLIPHDLTAKLRNYQQNGLRWLQHLDRIQLGGLLADDMGLGKTLQVLAYIAGLKEQQQLSAPVLVLAPTSVVYNWQTEAAKFTPGLNTRLIQGNQRSALLENLRDADLVITSYALISRDLSHYLDQSFRAVIVDEAQVLKSKTTALYKSLSQLSARQWFALTGTPVENHLGELWTKFSLLQPALLGNQSQFNQLFRKPIEKHNDKQAQQRLMARIEPFVLRREKRQVATELPEKTEIIQYVPLDEKQRLWYETVRASVDEKIRALIAQQGIASSQIDILSAMVKLRQICCHPALLPQANAKRVKRAGKLDWLAEMLPPMLAEGRKILIFSQFTSMLDKVNTELNALDIDTALLTGATADRPGQIERFTQGQASVFLISLKAGGSGLNLTEADTVIHLEPWWNPSAQQQATDRAYRIGQTRRVMVYHLIAPGTIEERMLALQAGKQRLAEQVIPTVMGQQQQALSAESIAELLKPLN